MNDKLITLVDFIFLLPFEIALFFLRISNGNGNLIFDFKMKSHFHVILLLVN